jgi:hypothetical protein
MLSYEKALFEEIMKCIDFSDKRLNENLNGKREEDVKNQLIVFKTDVEEFVGMDGEKLGPFDKGQIANLPREITKILMDDGKAELCED